MRPSMDRVLSRKMSGCNRERRGVRLWREPLCFTHWKDFDRYFISECDRCHWFSEDVGEGSDDDLCYECEDRERRGYPPSSYTPMGQYSDESGTCTS